MEAERDVVELKKVQFMQRHLGEEFDGFITGVTGFGFFVELEELFVEGLVHITTLDDDLYTHLEKQHSLIGAAQQEGLPHRRRGPGQGGGGSPGHAADRVCPGGAYRLGAAGQARRDHHAP